MKKTGAVLSLMLIASVGCSKSWNPTNPSPTPTGNDVSYTILSGEDGSNVSATVEVVGKNPVTTVNGQAQFSGVFIGNELTINSPGFIERFDRVRGYGSQTIYLWPDRPGFDQNFTQQLIYTEAGHLIRLNTGVVYFKLPPDLNDPLTRSRQQEAVNKMTAATEGKITFLLDDNPPSGSVIIEAVIDPAALPGNASAAADRRYQQYASPDCPIYGRTCLIGGRIIYRNKGYAQNVLVICHETGHMLGLGHVTSQPSLMNPDNPSDLTSGDILGIRMLLRRTPGNLFPDNGRSIS